MAEKLLETDSLRQGFPKINNAIDHANDALNKSTTAENNSTNAVNTANAAKTKAEQVETEFDAVVNRATDSDAMSAQAAVDAKGVNKGNLKQRLDDDYNEVTSQLAQLPTQQDLNNAVYPKADQGFVVTELQKKREVTTKLEPEDLSERTLSLVTGQGTINLESIPQDESVTPKKLQGLTYEISASKALFEKKQQDLYKTRDYNILENVKNGNPPALFDKGTGATVEYINNNTSLFSTDEYPKIMRYRVTNTGSSPTTVRARIGKLVEKPTYYFSAWFRLSDLLALNEVAPFRPYFILYDFSSASLGGGDFDTIFTNEQLSTLGYSKTKTFTNVGIMTTTIQDIKDDWVFIQTKFQIIRPLDEVKEIAIFMPRFTIVPVGINKSVDILNLSVTTEPFSSYNIPYANETERITIEGQKIIQKSSSLQGKKWVLDGDSNTEANSHANKKYYDIIAEQTGVRIENHAVSGTGYMTRVLDGTTYNPVYTRIPNYSADADIITVLAGGNNVTDMALGNITLGKMGDTDPNASFYGALDYTFKIILEKYPTKKVAALSQFKRGNYPVEQTQAHENIIQPMVKALKDVCGFYGIPILDLYNGGNVHMRTSTFVSGASSDGIHLNNTGHELIANKIKTFLESL